MGRKSKLTPEQWAEIDRRVLLDGASVFQIAKEFGINESSIRRKITPNCADRAESHPEIRALAARKSHADAEALSVAQEIAKLSPQNQTIVARLAELGQRVMTITDIGSKTALRLVSLANSEMAKVDDADPSKSIGELQGVALLTKMSNDALVPTFNLLAANKEAMARAGEGDSNKPMTLDEFYR